MSTGASSRSARSSRSYRGRQVPQPPPSALPRPVLRSGNRGIGGTRSLGGGAGGDGDGGGDLGEERGGEGEDDMDGGDTNGINGTSGRRGDPPQEIHCWDLTTGTLVQRYHASGFRQGRFVLRSAFGGARSSIVVCGSEDANVYMWHRYTGALLDVLSGHASTVNSVEWSPTNHSLFARCVTVSRSSGGGVCSSFIFINPPENDRECPTCIYLCWLVLTWL